MNKISILAITIILGVSGFTTAGALNRDQIPAGTNWLFHFDLDALRASDLGQLIQNDIISQEQEKIAAMTELLGSDLTQDLYGVTVYGAEGGPENATALFDGKFNPAKLTALLTLNKAYTKSDYNGCTLHHWQDEKHGDKSQVGAFAKENLIVIGQTKESVTDLLDVMAGKSGSLSGLKDSALNSLCETADQPILFVAAQGLSELVGDNPNAAIMKNSRIFAALAAEKDGNLKLNVHLEAETEEAAIQMEQLVRGMMALAMLHTSDDPAAARLLQAIALIRNANALDLEFKYPSAELYEIIKQHVEDGIEFDFDEGDFELEFEGKSGGVDVEVDKDGNISVEAEKSDDDNDGDD